MRAKIQFFSISSEQIVARTVFFLVLASSIYLCGTEAKAQCGDTTFRIMTWNLLNFPSQSNLVADTTTRLPCYRAVIDQIDPDIIVTQENTDSNSVSIFLNSVLNTQWFEYEAGTFINGYDTDNAIYIKTSCLRFISNVPIHTALRDVNEFTVTKPGYDTLKIFSCHLKASSGAANEALRAAEVDSIRKFTNALPPGTNFIIVGDFNFYSSYEPGYQELLHNDSITDGEFTDPLTMPGVWNDYDYRSYHTQSPRDRSFGGGATGGMDDRFDLILLSSVVAASGDIEYVSGSLKPFGNDGQHYQDSINRPPNAAVSQAVANALNCASDHLPVFADFIFHISIGIDEVELHDIKLKIYPNPANEEVWTSIDLKNSVSLTFEVYDIMSRKIKSIHREFGPGLHKMNLAVNGELKKGNYFLRVSSEGQTNSSSIFTVE